MKNKSAKISTDQLFFSHTWNFLNVYLVKQVGRSQATAESYRDSLTIFKNYLVGELGKSISTFQFSDCTKECIYNFREYLLANGSQPSTVNVRVAAIRAYLTMPRIWTYQSSQLPWRSVRSHHAKPLKRKNLFCPMMHLLQYCLHRRIRNSVYETVLF